MALISAIGDNPLADACAKEAAEVLVTAYPNHGWWVECKGGVLVIKHLEASGARGLIGMLRKMDQLSHDAGRRKREILIAAGELLERAGLRRGARNEDPVTHLELDDKTLAKYWHAPHRVLQ
jgi:hypothetical protein